MLNSGKIYKRRQRISSILTKPKSFKEVAKELGISNSLAKSDLLEMLAERQVKQDSDKKYYVNN